MLRVFIFIGGNFASLQNEWIMTKFSFFLLAASLCLASCTTHKLPAFSNQQWHVDPHSGNAVSTAGTELAFGSEWMITDTTLMQTAEQIAAYPKLSSHLASGIAQFPEIKVDSVLFYNPHRGLLFVAYHQAKPLKPTSEIGLYNDSAVVYSKEYARIFGNMTTYIDDDGWEIGPSESVYSNVRYNPNHKRLVLLQRLPHSNIAVFVICYTNTKKGKWWENYPPGTLWNIDLGDTDNLERISSFLHSSRNLAVENLKLALPE